jgi:hypothetical protein
MAGDLRFQAPLRGVQNLPGFIRHFGRGHNHVFILPILEQISQNYSRFSFARGVRRLRRFNARRQNPAAAGSSPRSRHGHSFS